MKDTKGLKLYYALWIITLSIVIVLLGLITPCDAQSYWIIFGCMMFLHIVVTVFVIRRLGKK